MRISPYIPNPNKQKLLLIIHFVIYPLLIWLNLFMSTTKILPFYRFLNLTFYQESPRFLIFYNFTFFYYKTY